LTPLLELRGVHVRLDMPDGREVHAVRGIDLTLDEGERFGLIGESGCGKTTTMLTILGLLPPTATVSGEILFRGEDILRRGEEGIRRHRSTDIALVPQSAMNALNPVRTIGSQLIELLRYQAGAGRTAARARAAELLELVEVPPARLASYPHELSGGMRQRVCIAMALACEPALLLADEPTTALDVIVQAQILDVLRRLSEQLGLGLILVTHDVPIVSTLCHRGGVMYGGRLVETASVLDLYRAPAHPYTAALLAAVPDLHVEHRGGTIPGRPPSLSGDLTGCPFEPRCPNSLEICRVEDPAPERMGPGQVARCHNPARRRPERDLPEESSERASRR
jgi:peptide/nickel transport system ATP-binding protein